MMVVLFCLLISQASRKRIEKTLASAQNAVKLSLQLHSTASTWTFTTTEDLINATSVAKHFVNDITLRSTTLFTQGKNLTSVSTAIRHLYRFTIGETTNESTQERNPSNARTAAESFVMHKPSKNMKSTSMALEREMKIRWRKNGFMRVIYAIRRFRGQVRFRRTRKFTPMFGLINAKSVPGLLRVTAIGGRTRKAIRKRNPSSAIFVDSAWNVVEISKGTSWRNTTLKRQKNVLKPAKSLRTSVRIKLGGLTSDWCCSRAFKTQENPFEKNKIKGSRMKLERINKLDYRMLAFSRLKLKKTLWIIDLLQKITFKCSNGLL